MMIPSELPPGTGILPPNSSGNGHNFMCAGGDMPAVFQHAEQMLRSQMLPQMPPQLNPQQMRILQNLQQFSKKVIGIFCTIDIL